MSKTEFVAIIAYLANGCGKPLARDAHDVYFELLGDLPADKMRLAVQLVLLQHRWATFPSIAEIREAAIDVIRGQIQEIPSAEAWRMAWKAIAYCDPEVDGSVGRAMEGMPPLVLKAIRTMGIPTLCYGKEPVAVVRAQFTRIYEQIVAGDKREALMPARTKHEIENHPIRRMLADIGKPVSKE